MDKLFNIIRASFYTSSTLITELRKCKHYEIELYTKRGGIAIIDDKSYEKLPGIIMFSRPGTKRQSVGAFECQYVHFECTDKEFEKKYLNMLPDTLETDDIPYYANLFSDISSALSANNEAKTLISNSLLSLLIGRVFEECQKDSKEDEKFLPYKSEIIAAQRFIDQHYGTKLNLDELSHIAHLSPSYFHLAFKSFFGKTPYEYIFDVRIAAAKKMLANTEQSLSYIAEKCGFTSQSYFNYSFKKATGKTPKKYREAKHIAI